MAREELRGLTPSRVRPAAAPVDTFVVPTPSRGEQLASALSEFATGVAKTHLQSEAIRRKQDEERVMSNFAALQGEYMGWADLIKDHPELESESPFFRYLMEQQLGEAAGKRAGDRVFDSIYNGELSTMDADFDTVAGKLIDDEVGTLDGTSEAFRLGLARKSAQELDRARQTFRGQQSELRFNAANDGFVASVEEVLWSRPENMAANIDALIIRGINGNMNPARLNDLTLTAIRNVALQTQDLSLFNLIDELPTKGGYVGDIPSIDAKRRKYIEEVNLAIDRVNARSDAAKRREDILIGEQVDAEIWRRLNQNPQADISDQLEILGSRGMKEDYNAALAYQRTLLEGSVAQDSPYVRQQLMGRLYDQYNPLTARELNMRLANNTLGQGDHDYVMRFVVARNTAQQADSPNKETYTRFTNEAAERAKLKIGTLFNQASAGVDQVLEDNARREMRMWIAEHLEELDALGETERLAALENAKNRVVALERARAIRTDTGDLQNLPSSQLNRTVAERVSEHSVQQVYTEDVVMQALPVVDRFMYEAQGQDAEAQNRLFNALPSELQLWVRSQLAGYTAQYGAGEKSKQLNPYQAAMYTDQILLELFFILHGQENYHRFKESR